MLTLPANLEHRSHPADHFIRGEAGSGRPLPSIRPTWGWLWEANRCSSIPSTLLGLAGEMKPRRRRRHFVSFLLHQYSATDLGPVNNDACGERSINPEHRANSRARLPRAPPSCSTAVKTAKSPLLQGCPCAVSRDC